MANLRISAKSSTFAPDMRRIEYISPVDWVRGSLSGGQILTYDGGTAYEQSGSVPADTYRPQMVAKVLHVHTKRRLRYYQIRTRTSINITPANKANMACMGGAAALFAALVTDKTSTIYIDCMRVCPANMTLRQFLFPVIRTALAAKSQHIDIADGVYIVNPWVSAETPNVPIAQAIINKFASELT